MGALPLSAPFSLPPFLPPTGSQLEREGGAQPRGCWRPWAAAHHTEGTLLLQPRLAHSIGLSPLPWGQSGQRAVRCWHVASFGFWEGAPSLSPPGPHVYILHTFHLSLWCLRCPHFSASMPTHCHSSAVRAHPTCTLCLTPRVADLWVAQIHQSTKLISSKHGRVPRSLPFQNPPSGCPRSGLETCLPGVPVSRLLSLLHTAF